jgi:hypothetical protein
MFVPRRRSSEEASAVNCLLGKGLSDYEIERRTGVSRSSVQRWRTKGVPQQDCSRPSKWRPTDSPSYCYLLGIYLGDGYLSKASSRSQVLEISLDPRYPAIVDECLEAVQRTVEARPRASRRTTPKGEAIRLVATSPLWTLAFPQHGTGKKHERAIVLADWQQRLVDRFPKQFLRGLIHADGSRVINRFRVELASGPREYAYPRYFFTNLSRDIQRLFCESCDRLEIRWTRSSCKNISVADRRSVALLDSFVGPKN